MLKVQGYGHRIPAQWALNGVHSIDSKLHSTYSLKYGQRERESTYFLQYDGGTSFRISILVMFPDSTSGSSRSDNKDTFSWSAASALAASECFEGRNPGSVHEAQKNTQRATNWRMWNSKSISYMLLSNQIRSWDSGMDHAHTVAITFCITWFPLRPHWTIRRLFLRMAWRSAKVCSVCG